jgi:hypothetical protein
MQGRATRWRQNLAGSKPVGLIELRFRNVGRFDQRALAALVLLLDLPHKAGDSRGVVSFAEQGVEGLKVECIIPLLFLSTHGMPRPDNPNAHLLE